MDRMHVEEDPALVSALAAVDDDALATYTETFHCLIKDLGGTILNRSPGFSFARDDP